jgi:hypothetical protein
MIVGTTNNCVFTAGILRDILAIADYSSVFPGTILVQTSTNHNLVNGDTITIYDTTSYNGVYQVGIVDDTQFIIVAGFVSTETGVIVRGDRLRVDYTGVYNISLSLTAWSAVAGKVVKFELNKNVTALDNLVISHEFTTTENAQLSVAGLVNLSVSEDLWISILNQTSATDITIRHCNVTLERVIN